MGEKKLLAAYLICGEDELKRDTTLSRLRTRVLGAPDADLDYDQFDAATASGADVVAACNTLPFMSERRLVVLTGAESLKKPDSEALVAYLKAPSDTAVLAIVARKLAANTRLYKAAAAVGATAVIDCSPKKKKNEWPALVRSMATTHGIVFSDAAARRLLDLVGENTVHLDAEIKKIALAHEGTRPVGPREVEELVACTANVKPWDFVNAFAARDAAMCVSMFNRPASSLPSPFYLLGECVQCLRELLTCHSLASRGQGNAAAVAAELKMPDWRARNRLGDAKKWTSAELRRAISSARDAERAMKSGTDPATALLDWVLATTCR